MRLPRRALLRMAAVGASAVVTVGAVAASPVAAVPATITVATSTAPRGGVIEVTGTCPSFGPEVQVLVTATWQVYNVFSDWVPVFDAAGYQMRLAVPENAIAGDYAIEASCPEASALADHRVAVTAELADPPVTVDLTSADQVQGPDPQLLVRGWCHTGNVPLTDVLVEERLSGPGVSTFRSIPVDSDGTFGQTIPVEAKVTETHRLSVWCRSGSIFAGHAFKTYDIVVDAPATTTTTTTSPVTTTTSIVTTSPPASSGSTSEAPPAQPVAAPASFTG